MIHRYLVDRSAVVLGLVLLAGCGPEAEPDVPRQSTAERSETAALGTVEPLTLALAATIDRSMALADSVEDLLRPVPLMRPGEEAALRRYLNDAHVSRARSLGVRPSDRAEVEALVEAGRLVRLEDSTAHWIVREGVGGPFVTPETRDLLRRIGERFQDHLAERGLPPYRLEVTSVLRTAAQQASLRRRNPNAAAGTSSHEFATTLDIAYEAFAPPSPLPDGLIPDDAPGEARPYLERVAALALESVSARKSRELTKHLGDVLAAMQSNGDVLVILERQQPVFHITLGR